MKTYIAGRISTDPNYKAKFKKAEEVLQAHGCIVMNPAVLPAGFKWEEYMSITMAMLEVCDAIVLLPGWRKSRGAKREYYRARTQGKIIMEIDSTWRLRGKIYKPKGRFDFNRPVSLAK